MPQRFLKPGIISSKGWDSQTWMGQSFYIRLLTLVDDFGRYEADPVLLKSQAFPLREDLTSALVKEMCQSLHDAGLVIFYVVNGKPYLQITKWTERARSATSKYPSAAESCEPLRNPAESCHPLPPKSSSSSSSSSSPLVIDQKPSADSLSCQQVSASDDGTVNRWPESKAPVEKVDRQAVTRERIGTMHEWYCGMTSEQPLTMTVERSWYEFLRLFSEDDFKKVFGYLRKQIRESKRNEGAIKLSNMLQPDKFAEDLALAKTNLNKPMQSRQAPQSEVNPAGKALLPSLTAAMKEAVEKGTK